MTGDPLHLNNLTTHGRCGVCGMTLEEYLP